jgi:hypothetical protein
MRPFFLMLVVAACVGCAGAAAPGSPALPGEPDFPGLSSRLSEESGFFPSDNLVSNETSYQHVLGKMRAMGVTGGAYVGVGPDQNFTYIAAIRPEIAFILDIRRDNLLHHLLFKAAFQHARSRLEFISMLTGRPAHEEAPADPSVEAMVARIDAVATDSQYFEVTATRFQDAIQTWGMALTDADLRVVRRIHEAFRRYGLNLRYAQVSRYPTWRDLILETDLEGNRASYLASDSAFRFIQDLTRRHRIVPVVGDVAGPHALDAIGDEIRNRQLSLSALYISNVEQYLMRGGTFPAFAETVQRLPWAEQGVIIRSYFGRGAALLPQSVSGHYSTQLLERSTDFINQMQMGGYTSYIDLVTRNALPLRTSRGSDAGPGIPRSFSGSTSLTSSLP